MCLNNAPDAPHFHPFHILAQTRTIAQFPCLYIIQICLPAVHHSERIPCRHHLVSTREPSRELILSEKKVIVFHVISFILKQLPACRVFRRSKKISILNKSLSTQGDSKFCTEEFILVVHPSTHNPPPIYLPE